MVLSVFPQFMARVVLTPITYAAILLLACTRRPGEKWKEKTKRDQKKN